MASLRVISVAVKHKNADGQEYEVQPLRCIMYLSAWDVYVPATYRGAPPICHFCRQSGHIRATCPVLAKRQCFKCRKLGHMARFCREEETPFEEALDEYKLSNKAREETKTADTQNRTKRGEYKKRRGAAPAVSDLAKQPLPLKDVTADKPATTDDNTFLVSSEVTMDIDPKALERTP
ncbi:hypothetical protein MAM1_0012c01265 [Mucor ambiguus]|uniref:CCHC-type domain-containing protein n=1 Tax=Mucor ambiguus TaxID=91626 RepID=A0A0C9LR05_9FUNG|nr:hypothetical protein MAM1_0012c01265 [Mucor ambiguus]